MCIRDSFSTYLQKVLNLNSSSPYAIELKNEIRSKQEVLFGSKKDFRTYIIGFLLGLLILAGVYIIYLKKQILASFKKQHSPIQLKDRINSLSKKETEVFQQIINGKSNKEIASLLFIEVTTVKSHISKIYQKLDVKSRKEALEIGLIHRK